MDALGVTIEGQAFAHLVYHFVLTHSNWEHVSVCFSESFASLSEGLQNALWALGGVPQRHRTDRMTLAVHRDGNAEEYTAKYGVAGHYGLTAEATNPTSGHENGDCEQGHRRFKEAVDQALLAWQPGLRQPGGVHSLSAHSSHSCGSARTRSAMMLRWICCVPPYTVAAREYRYVSCQKSFSAAAAGSACSSVVPRTSSAVAASRCSASAMSSLTLELSVPTAPPFRNSPTVRYAWWRRTSTPTSARARATCARGIVDQRRAVDGALGRHPHGAVQPGAELDLSRQRGGAALVTERVHRDLPAVAELAEEVRPGDDDVVEEQLAELGMAGDLRHRPQLDARRAHVDDEHRDPAVLGPGLVRAGQHPAPAGELPPRDPGLLAADHEVVAALLRPGAQRREVRPGVGLGEALAPDLLGREDRRDVPAALLVAAEAQQRGPEHVEADDVGELRGSRCRQLLVDHDLLGRGPPRPPNSSGQARPT